MIVFFAMSFILRAPKTTARKKIVNYFSQCVQKFTVKIIDGVFCELIMELTTRRGCRAKGHVQ